MADKTPIKTRAVEIESISVKAKELNKELAKCFKRKTRELDLVVENFKRARTEGPKFKVANIQ